MVLNGLRHLGCHRIVIELADQADDDCEVESVAFHWKSAPPKDTQLLADIRAHLESLCLNYARNMQDVSMFHFEHHDDIWYGLAFFRNKEYVVFHLQQDGQYQEDPKLPRLRAALERILLQADLPPQRPKKDGRSLGL